MPYSRAAKFSGLDKHENTSYPFVFYLRDFFAFIILGAIGGCAGALFNWLNKTLTVWRRAHIKSIPLKGLEVVLLTSVMSSLQWWLPMVYKQCGKIQDLPEIDIDAAFVYRQFNCNDGEYNHLSTLFLNNLSTAINILFHAPPTAFTAMSCVISGTVYYVMLICLFGSSIGMGIFIPLLYIGGAFGRAIGLALTENWYPEGTTSSLVHTYSVVMATAMLGGVTQVLISLSVIMLQAVCSDLIIVNGIFEQQLTSSSHNSYFVDYCRLLYLILSFHSCSRLFSLVSWHECLVPMEFMTRFFT
jgi:chloride channel 7